jgi:NAD(P)-dependent dehydrogenase (short-subunit alcohol dehydrogenase family)
MAVSLEGKVAVVTGGSSGIARAVAVLFAREGAKVVLAARQANAGEKVAKEVEAAGGTALFVRADVSRAEEVRALVEQTI